MYRAGRPPYTCSPQDLENFVKSLWGLEDLCIVICVKQCSHYPLGHFQMIHRHRASLHTLVWDLWSIPPSQPEVISQGFEYMPAICPRLRQLGIPLSLYERLHCSIHHVKEKVCDKLLTISPLSQPIFFILISACRWKSSPSEAAP